MILYVVFGRKKDADKNDLEALFVVDGKAHEDDPTLVDQLMIDAENTGLYEAVETIEIWPNSTYVLDQFEYQVRESNKLKEAVENE